MDDREWGPWVEHDGTGCPVVLGTKVRVQFEKRSGSCCISDGIAGSGSGKSWFFSEWTRGEFGPNGLVHRVVRYRIRKPRALAQLVQLVEDLPTPVRELEDA